MEFVLFGVVVVAVVGLYRALSDTSNMDWHPVKIETVTSTSERPTLEEFATLQIGQDVIFFVRKGNGASVAVNATVTAMNTRGGVLEIDAAYLSVYTYSKSWKKTDGTPKAGTVWTAIPASYVLAVYAPKDVPIVASEPTKLGLEPSEENPGGEHAEYYYAPDGSVWNIYAFPAMDAPDRTYDGTSLTLTGNILQTPRKKTIEAVKFAISSGDYKDVGK